MIQLNKILNGFRKTIDQLDRLIASNHAAVTRNDAQMERIRNESNALLIEASKAGEVSTKLKHFIGE